jgi:hypothetical protein
MNGKFLAYMSENCKREAWDYEGLEKYGNATRKLKAGEDAGSVNPLRRFEITVDSKF